MSGKRTLLPPASDPCECDIVCRDDTFTLFLADARALVRLQSDHINRTVVPAFYRFLQAQDLVAQITAGKEFVDAIETLVSLFERAEREVGGTGLWKGNGELNLADVLVGPCEYLIYPLCADPNRFRDVPGDKCSQSLSRLGASPGTQVFRMVDEGV